MKRSDADTNLPSRVKLVEVAPREGLQHEPLPVITTATKAEFINRLALCGLQQIEVASFIEPSNAPQLTDGKDLLRKIERQSGVSYCALTNDEKGVEQAIASCATEIAVFTSASERYCQQTLNCSIGETLQRFQPAIKIALANKLPVRAYVTTALGCPYGGDVSPASVARVCQALDEMGCYEISLGDTTGMGTPLVVKRMLQRVKQVVPVKKLAIHFHDTYGQALANIYAALQEGVTVIDSSVAGLGNCPHVRGAPANVATEDVLFLLNGLDIDTGVDKDALAAVSLWICQTLNRDNGSRVSKAINGQC